MEVKYNESTGLRPGGERLMDGPVVPIDVPNFLKEIKGEKTWQDSDRNAIAIYKTDALRIVLIALHKDAVLDKHTTNGYVSIQVLEGHVTFTVEGKPHHLAKGQMIVLHPNIPHSVVAADDAVLLLTIVDFAG